MMTARIEGSVARLPPIFPDVKYRGKSCSIFQIWASEAILINVIKQILTNFALK